MEILLINEKEMEFMSTDEFHEALFRPCTILKVNTEEATPLETKSVGHHKLNTNLGVLKNTLKCVQRPSAPDAMITHHLLVPLDSLLLNREVSFDVIHTSGRVLMQLTLRNEINLAKDVNQKWVVGLTVVDQSDRAHLLFAREIRLTRDDMVTYVFEAPSTLTRYYELKGRSVSFIVRGVLFQPSKLEAFTQHNDILSWLSATEKETFRLRYNLISRLIHFIPWLYQGMGFKEPYLIDTFKYFENHEIAAKLLEVMQRLIRETTQVTQLSFTAERAAFMEVWNLLKGV